MTKELVLSVTRDDCIWKYATSSGPGGQHRNKTATAVTCTHKASGAIGHAADDKSQWRNRQHAFRRMSETEVFKTWLLKETSRSVLNESEERQRIERAVARAMRDENLKIEVQAEGGEWVVME
jgi:protein subunit release factor B